MSNESTAAECKAFRAAVSDFLDGHVTAMERADLEVHLGDCTPCEEFVHGIRVTLSWLSKLREGAVLDEGKTAAARLFCEYFPEPDLPEDLADWTGVKETWGNLSGLTGEGRALVIREGGQYLDPHLCDWLLARARRASSVSPDRAVPLAETAVEIARQLELKRGDSSRLSHALEALAGSLVLLREFASASAVLRELEGLCSAIDCDSEEKARYLTSRGLYYSQTGQFQKGELCLARALDVRRVQGSRRGVICDLVNLAGAVLSAGDGRRALGLYREAEGLLRTKEDPPRLQLAVHSNLMLALCETHETNEARAVLPNVRGLAATVGGWYSRVYATWLEGTLLRVERRHEESEKIFESVRSEFCARGHLVWHVEASLDLARVYLHQGRLEDLNALASQLLLRAEEMNADKQVWSAVLSFAEASRRRSLSTQVISSIAIALSSARLSQRF